MSLPIVVKTLKGETHQLDVEPAMSVSELKETIHSNFGLGEPDTQKLIYQGKILKDNQTVGDAKIKPKSFVVLMISKKKSQTIRIAQPPQQQQQPPQETAPPQEPVAPQSTEASSSTAASNPPSQPESQPEQQQQPAAAQPSQPAQDNPAPASGDAAADDDMLLGARFNEAIEQFISMGFAREQSVMALRAAFGNAERAIEYLFSGIPAHLQQQARAPQSGAAAPQAQAQPAPQAQTQPAAQQPQAQQPQQPQPAAAQQQQGGQGQGDMPSPAELAQLLQNNPQLMQMILQQLAQSNPELLQQIQQNPQQFAQALQDPNVQQQLLGPLLAGMMGGGGGGGGGGNPNVIRVTQEEKEAIDRLTALGFSRERCIEAFFACDKNEAMAANYLFDQMGGDEDDFAQGAVDSSNTGSGQQS